MDFSTDTGKERNIYIIGLQKKNSAQDYTALFFFHYQQTVCTGNVCIKHYNHKRTVSLQWNETAQLHSKCTFSFRLE